MNLLASLFQANEEYRKKLEKSKVHTFVTYVYKEPIIVSVSLAKKKGWTQANGVWVKIKEGK